MRNKPLKGSLILVSAALLSALSHSSRADEETITILAPWEAEGKTYKIGPKRTQFVGAFEGIMYIDAGEGELDAALFGCPTVHELNVGTASVMGIGIASKIGMVDWMANSLVLGQP